MTRVYIAACPLGIFVFDSGGRMLENELFKGPADEISWALASAGSEELSEEEKKLVKKLGAKEIIFETKKKDYRHEFPNPAGEALRSDLYEIAAKSGAVKSREALMNIVTSVAAELSKAAVKESVTEDKLLVQAVNAIDDIEGSANLIVLRLREWYGLYYPELVDGMSSNEKLAAMIAGEASREKLGAKDSMGGNIKMKDVEEMQGLAKSVVELYGEKKRLEKYIDMKAVEVMPSSCKLISPLLAARMVAAAGTLDRLARFPSSTVQIIGAEKALFRHMKGQGSSPKHGLLFQNPLVNQAPKKLRGKVARVLASKLSISLKLDRYGGKPDGGRLKKELDSRLKSIMVRK